VAVKDPGKLGFRVRERSRSEGSSARGRGETSVLTLASVYVGTVVGAGFTSGQEVLQFFAFHGVWGIAGLALATAVLGLSGYLLLRGSHKLNARSYWPVLEHTGGRLVGRVIDGVLTFFLFGGTAAMFAGAGATLRQEYNLPYAVGLLGMAAATLLTVLTGLKGVVKSVSFVVPFLLVTVLAVSVVTLVTGAGPDFSFARPDRAAVPDWALSGVAYGSYNLILAASVLAPLARHTAREKLLPGAFLGALGLGVGALAVNLVILALLPRAAEVEVPMVLAAGRLSPLAALIFTAVLLAEVYTTAVGSLFGLVNRIVGEESRRYRALAAGATVAAVAAGALGFSTIVSTLYPAVGYAGFLLLGALGLAWARGRI